MRFRRFQLITMGLVMAMALATPAQGESTAPVQLTPSEINLASDPSRPGGMEMAILSGEMNKPGLYSARIRIPAQLMIQPHIHPEERMVIVLSGTLHVGYGERFDPSRMKAMPPGSFFTEPAGQPHFAWTQTTDVVVQVSGIGPSGTVYVDTGKPGD